jgi:hypothetical protein
VSAASRKSSSGASTTDIAQSEHAYPTTIAPTHNQRPAPTATLLRACAVGVSPCTFFSTLSHILAYACVLFGDRARSDAHHAAPKMHGAPPAAHTHTSPLPFTRQPGVRGPPMTRRRRRLPPAVAPSQSKTPKTRGLLQDRPSITQELREFGFGGALTLGAP